MKGTILNAHIEGKNTYVTKQTKYGTFKGKAVLHPEDEDVYSEIRGYTIAELKCDIQALKAKAEYFRQRMLGIQHAYNVLWKSGIDINDPIMVKLNRQKDVAQREFENAYEIYKINRDTLTFRIERNLDFARKAKQKKN